MKNQALFSSKVKSKKIKCRLLQFLFGALWVKLRSIFFAFEIWGQHLSNKKNLFKCDNQAVVRYCQRQIMSCSWSEQ